MERALAQATQRADCAELIVDAKKVLGTHRLDTAAARRVAHAALMTTLTSPAVRGRRCAFCVALGVAPTTCYRARDRARRAKVFAMFLDEGTCLRAERTMYLLFADAYEVRERRAQRRHPVYAPPELLATGANQLWSSDITNLKGPTMWSALHLYVVLDVCRRYVVG